MSQKIIVQPVEDYFIAFLSTRGINVVEEDANVIHYFGDSKRKLKKLVDDHDPDLVIIHNKNSFDKDYKFPFALDEVTCDKDIYVPRQVITNALDLSRLHYQSLGLERQMYDLMEDIKRERKEKLKRNSSNVKKIFDIMMWD